MSVYIVNWLIITLSAFFIRSRKLSVIFLGMLLFFILACRDDFVGADLSVYKLSYSIIQKNTFLEMITSIRFFKSSNLTLGSESGYDLLQWIFGKLGFSFHSFLIIHAAFCIYSISYFIYKYSKQPWFSFVIFVTFLYSTYFGILRQSLGSVIILFSIDSIYSRNIKRFFLLLILAILFHRSCIMFLPFYFLSQIRFNKINYFLYCIICILWGFSLHFIFNKLTAYLLSFTAGGNSYAYIEFKSNNMIFLMFVISVFIALYSNRLKILTEKNNILIWGYMLCLPIEIMSLYSPLFSRAAIVFYFMFTIILIPNILKTIENKYLQCVFTIIIYSFCLIFYITKFDFNIYPYRTFHY